MENTLRFFWNGIKGTDGKLQKASFNGGELISFPSGTITIYAKNYAGFTKEISQFFDVKNDSDGMTDYFENDRIRVTPDHALYGVVKAALDARELHYEKRFAKAGM